MQFLCKESFLSFLKVCMCVMEDFSDFINDYKCHINLFMLNILKARLIYLRSKTMSNNNPCFQRIYNVLPNCQILCLSIKVVIKHLCNSESVHVYDEGFLGFY